MFFILRMAFWLGLVLVLLPTDKSPDADKLPQIGTMDAMTAAGAAVSDMSQFCARQPAACEIGGQAATVIGHRAQAGAKKVYQMITEKKPDHTGSIDHDGNELANGDFAPADTLSKSDLRIKYRAPMDATSGSQA